MNNSTRKRVRPTIQDRLTPCFCCGYPLTQMHHVIPFAEYGEGPIVHLCPNCHEMYHLYRSNSTLFYRAAKKLGQTSRLILLFSNMDDYAETSKENRRLRRLHAQRLRESHE